MKNCPNISPVDDINLNKVSGTWRLGYLFIDDLDELEEDNTCLVVEIMQINETKSELLLYIDNRKNEYEIDRYTKEFDLTFISPGEWIIHTSFMHIEWIHVTVVDYTDDRMILTFCAKPFSPESLFHSKLDDTESDKISQSIIDNEEKTINDIYKLQAYDKLLKDFDDIKMNNNNNNDFTSKLFRGKRRISKMDSTKFSYKKMLNYFNKSSSGESKKHLWTGVLVKNNKVSPFEFIESASLLMKHGFNISKGQLVSFGGCRLT